MPESLLAELRDNLPTKDDRRILNFQHQGYLVIVGKNSYSNERIVSDHPHRECLWMHAMAARGSHVILCVHALPDPNDDVIQYAASLALKHSHSQARTVSIAVLKDVIKPEGSGIGIWKTTRSFSVEVLE